MINLEEIKRLADAATPGPWHHEEYTGFIFTGEVDYVEGVPIVDYFGQSFARPNDAAFVIAARAVVPDLVEEVKALRALVRDMLPHLADQGPWSDGYVTNALVDRARELGVTLEGE